MKFITIKQSNILNFEDLKYMEELLTGLNDIYVEPKQDEWEKIKKDLMIFTNILKIY